ncbi:MAG: pyridoxal phosphate-dependent aminotransferase [archaeon]
MKDISEREFQLPDAVIGKLLKIVNSRKDVISLGPGEPDFDTPKPILRKASKILSSYKKNRVTHYSSPQGTIELREAVAKKLKKFNKINVLPENIAVGCGTQELIFTSLMSVLDPSEQVIIPNPGYMGYVPAIELLNATPVSVQLKEENNFEINPDDIAKAVDKKKTRVIMLNTPSNPTGNVISKKILEEIADIAVDNDLYVFADEAYEQLIYDDRKHVSIGSLNGMKKYVLTLQTFSKSYAMCGFRVGYCAGPDELIKALCKCKDYTSICAPHFSQLLAVEALKFKDKFAIKMLKEYDRRRKMIVQRLNEMDLKTQMPHGAFYTFSNISKYSKNSWKFSEKLLEKGKVAVIPGTEFGKFGESYIRCSFATDYKKIEKAMDKIEVFLKKKQYK